VKKKKEKKKKKKKKRKEKKKKSCLRLKKGVWRRGKEKSKATI